MAKQQAERTSAREFRQLPEDARDCLQCLIILYGETHIDTLAQLLNLTNYAQIEFSHLCARRLRKQPLEASADADVNHLVSIPPS